MRLHTFALTDIGMKRKINQDAFLKDDALGLFLVADGMGGHKGGEVASQLAVTVIRDFCQTHSALAPRERLDGAVNEACRRIFQESSENTELAGMGTTILAMLVENGVVHIAQVGDSRAYLIHGGQIWRVTEDHSLLNEEIRAGRISANQAQNYQFKNVITRSVGYEKQVVVDIYRREAKAGDTFLLCTDGLSGLVQDGEMAELFKKSKLDATLGDLVALANSRGGDDNITVLACRIEST